jgi:uncharacterized repeat protein (TIGR01451 family)
MRRLLPQLSIALVVVGCLFAPAVASADPPGLDLPCSDASWSWSCGGLGPDDRDLVSGQPYHHNFKDRDTQGGATLGVTFSADGTTGYFTSDRGLSDYTVAFCDGTIIDVETVGGDQKTFTFSYDKPIRSIRVKAATTNRTFLSRKCGGDGGGGGGGTTKLSIVKRVQKHQVRPGETTTFTVVVRNTGAVTATNVQVCDRPDDNWAFVSASPLTPTVTGNVSCFALGDLASGDQTKLRIKLRLDPGVSAGAAVNSAVAWADNADQVKATAKLRIICKTAKITPDLLGVQKVEQTAALEPGQTRTIQVSCPTGFIATDGTPRVDAVDQGTGTLASVHVLAARAVSASTYEMVVENTSTGRAQLHLFVTCMAGQTANQHLAVQQSGPIEQTVSWGAGRQTATLTCPDGSQPIAPGYSLAGGAARIVESEATGDHAWTLGFVVSEPTTATLSIRCVDQQLGGPSGAPHRLEFTHVVTAVDVPAGQAQTAQVICGDQAKGIVATYDLASDLVLLGHDPQPKTRVFYLFNPTADTLHATLDLVCVSDRTAAAESCVASPAKHHGRGGKLRAALAARTD